RDGQYQLYADSMEPDGIGSLYIAFEQLKAKLSAEGLFSPDRKKPIPKIPARIGVITSPTGAAVRDIINITGRRFPMAEIVLYPALVQGIDAAASLRGAVRYFNMTGDVDVIIIGRGGGSIEDLWAFNDEILARDIAASRIPVIYAVGHETDFTICDFVSDVRAPTPSAAAELAVPDSDELKRKINNIVTREEAVLKAQINRLKALLDRYSKARCLSSPTFMVEEKRIQLDHLSEKLEKSADGIIAKGRNSLSVISGKLSALNPMAVISKGYSALFTEDGGVINSIRQFSVGENVNMILADGSAKAEIIEIEENNSDGK
ncbi:MAG: exodeoxyribonuclease VII large subunit, partial [Clostridia bacterium]|nr:exodeoxyribonuclease VII large subunit [Clostridia bacterium]